MEINNYQIHQFLNSNNYYIEENAKIKPDYFLINNQIIFDNDENNWKALLEKFNPILEKVKISGGVDLSKEMISIIDLVFFGEEENFIQRYTNFKKREKILIIYYLVDLQQNLGENLSKLILRLYNNLARDNQEYKNSNDNSINFINEREVEMHLHIISKLSFHLADIEVITVKNCNLTDKAMIILEKSFSNNLKKLYLDSNEISELTIFNNRQIFSNLEALNLSNNKITDITPLSKIKFDNLKRLDLTENELKYGIEEFTDSLINNRSENLILEVKKGKNGVELFFEYFKNLEIKFKYIIEEHDFNNLLKNISFNGIKHLKLKGFDNDAYFLCNKTLKDLKKLDLTEKNNINDLNMFRDISFININDILLNSQKIEKNFDALISFKSSIIVKNLTINLIDNDKYEFNAICTNPNITLSFNNADFLCCDILINIEKFIIPKPIFDEDGNCKNIFSYEALRNFKLSCFKNIRCEKFEIDYKESKYILKINFLEPKLDLLFRFDDLSFFEDNNKILSSSKKIILSNLTFKTMENFNSIEHLKLNNIYIENIETISKIYKFNLQCSNVKCNPDLIEPLENYNFNKKIYSNKIEYKKYGKCIKCIYYCFRFTIAINKDIINNIKSFKNYYSIKLTDSKINEEDILFFKNDCFKSLRHLILSNSCIKYINFLSYDSLTNLRELDLSKNEIEDISLFTEDYIKCKNIFKLNFSENKIRKGFEVLKTEYFQNKFLFIKILDIIKQDDNYIISLNFEDPICSRYTFRDLSTNEREKIKFNGFSSCYIDLYINDLNKIYDFIDNKNIFFSRQLPYLESLNINNEESDLKIKILKIIDDLFIKIKKKSILKKKCFMNIIIIIIIMMMLL